MTFQMTPPPRTEMMWFLNVLACIPVSGLTSADGMSVVEQWAPHGDSPPLHIHHSQDEVFVVLSGRLRIHVDGRDLFLDAGGSALAPKGVAHSYRVESPEGAHFMAITRGSDFETLVRSLGRPALRPELPEAMAPSPEAIAHLTRVCADNRIELVGPPLH